MGLLFQYRQRIWIRGVYGFIELLKCDFKHNTAHSLLIIRTHAGAVALRYQIAVKLLVCQ